MIAARATGRTARPQPPSALDQVLASYGGAADQERFAIDERDEMLHFLRGVHVDEEQARIGYYRSGHSIADTLAQVLRWRFGADGAPVLLDFASGYGRVTRFLLDAVPAERLWVSDILADAVAAQRQAFGVGGFVSTLRPEDLAAPRDFDAVACTSLFTHLPEERFHAWLGALWRLVRPGGVLLFSTHDSALHPLAERRGDAFVFERTSESLSLSLDDYGTTWVSEAFVRETLAAACGPAAAVRLSRAVCNFQDLWVVVPEPAASFSGLDLHSEPELMVDDCVVQGRELMLRGWALARHGVAKRVEVAIDGQTLGSVPVEASRPDVAAALGDGFGSSGWMWRGELPADAQPQAAVVVLRVVDGRGLAHLYWAGSVQLMQLLVRTAEARALRADLVGLRGELDSYRGWAGSEIATLQGLVAARDGQVATLDARIATLESVIGELQGLVAARDRRVAELERILAVRDSRVGELEGVVVARNGYIAAVEERVASLLGHVAGLQERLASLEWLAASREARVAELQTQVAAMQASRFWKLRDRWFAAKRALGLGGEP